MMKLTQIRHLVAVAERGSLTASAEAIGVSPGVLTRSIRELEQELGTTLFKRGKTSMTLTPVGEIFFRRAASAQYELDRASQDISQNAGLPVGLVSIGMSTSAHVLILPKILMPFQTRFEDVRVRIVEGSWPMVERDVRGGILDFYVGPIRPHQIADDLKIDKLSEAASIVVARKGHPLANATSLAQLTEARWIAPSRLELDASFEQHHLPKPIIVVEAETGLSMFSAVAASDALLMMSANWLPLIERTDLLTACRLNEALDSPSVFMITRTPLSLAPAAAYLRELVMRTPGGAEAVAENVPFD